MKQIKIEDALSNKSKDFLFFDTRSPKEFELDRIPNSINMPILDDEERHIVGYTFKQIDPDKAIEKGRGYFNKKISFFKEYFEKHKDKDIIVYCARGGMRSRTVVETFSKEYPGIYRLEGGYKSYRAYVRSAIELIKIDKAYVLYGLTGAGKTKILQKLDCAVDLEGLASHRNSVFGSIGLKPKSQKMFESLLLHRLKSKLPYIVLECESRKIGNLIVPDKIYNWIKNGVKIKISCSVDIRSKRIVEEYFDTEEKIEEIKINLPRLIKLMGVKKINSLNGLLDEKKYFEFSKIMLSEYYDILYNRTMEENDMDIIIDGADLDLAVSKVTEFINNKEKSD